jgi:hypothetical protein
MVPLDEISTANPEDRPKRTWKSLQLKMDQKIEWNMCYK